MSDDMAHNLRELSEDNMPYLLVVADAIDRLVYSLERIEASGAYPEAAMAQEALRQFRTPQSS